MHRLARCRAHRMGVVGAIIAAWSTCAWAQASAPPPKPRAAAASQTAPRPAAAKPRSPKTQPGAAHATPVGPALCVVPALGRTFEVKKIGLTIFTNSNDEVGIESWQIEDLVTREIGHLVGARLPVRALKIPPAALAAYEHPALALFADPAKDLVKAVRTAFPSAACAYYLLVNATTAQFGLTNQYLHGLGLVERSTIVDQFYVHAIFATQLYDGSTLERLKSVVPGQNWLEAGLSTPSFTGIHRKVDETWWPARPQTAAQSGQLRDATRALVEQGLAESIPRLWGEQHATGRHGPARADGSL